MKEQVKNQVNTQQNHSCIRAFAATIIEVVMTIATLMIASSILLPALSEARRQGKEVHCLANLGRIAAASLVYATADASELAIPVHAAFGLRRSLGEYEWGGKSGIGEPQVATELSSSPWGTAQGRGPATRPLNRILYGDVFLNHQEGSENYTAGVRNDTQLDLAVYRCPADSGYTGHHYLVWRDSKFTSFDHYGTSYTANTSWFGFAGSQCTLFSNSPYLLPISRVPAPAMTLLYLENCGRFGYRANYGGSADGDCGSFSGQLGSNVETDIRGWHGRPWMFEVAFVDGHASNVRMEGHQQPEPRLGHYPPRYMQPTDHSNWDCVIFRGPGWHKDTLPACPVSTTVPCKSPGSLIRTIG